MDFELTEAPPSGRKCAHGVRISPGDAIARYCGVCNPHPADRVLAAAMARKKPACRIYGEEKTLDVEAFLTQPVGARIVGACEFLEKEN